MPVSDIVVLVGVGLAVNKPSWVGGWAGGGVGVGQMLRYLHLSTS